MGKVAATYDFVDESGKLLYQEVRFEPKGFKLRRPDGKGGWVWHLECDAKCKCETKLPPVRRVLYNLPAVLQATFVLVVEGPKDCETARKLGLVATTNAMGAKAPWRPEYSESLRDKPLCLLADADAPGVAHTKDAARSLVGVAQSVKLIEALPGVPHKGDLTDYVQVGGTRESLLKLIDETPELTATDVAKWGAQKDSVPHESERLAKLVCFAEIQPKPLRWVWPYRIPAGKLSLIVGDPDKGKSLITIDITARITTGRPFPDDTQSESGSVIILSAEDDPEDTIRPRLDAAGANVSRVHLLKAVSVVQADGKCKERGFSLESDIKVLEDAIGQIPLVRLIVIDPISAYLGAADSHNNAEVRGLLAPLAELAARTAVAILAVTHLRKSGGAAIYRAMGSLAFAAAARATWGIAEDADDPEKRIMVRVKGNLSHDPGGLAYRIEVNSGIPRAAWEPGVVNLRADDVLGGDSPDECSERRAAEEWLGELLEAGSRPVKEIKEQSHEAGLAWHTVRRAADALRIKKQKSGFGGGWEWHLPEDAHHEDAQPCVPEVGTFEPPAENKGKTTQHSHEDAQSTGVGTFGGMGTFEDDRGDSENEAEGSTFTAPSEPVKGDEEIL